jgi:hypothetical protein
MKLRKGVKRAAGFDKAALGRLRHPLRLFDERCSSDDLLGCERLSDKIRCNCISPARVHKRLSMVFSIRTTRDLNRKSTTSWLARSPSEEWRSPTKLRRWRCFFAPKRLLS